MARPIILSNGELHVGINEYGFVNDFYYPYVGGENHAASHRMQHRIGIWVDGAFSWLDDGNWTINFNYLPETLIGSVTAKNDSLGILIETNDFIDSEQSAFIRNIHVVNLRDQARDIRLYMHQVFIISNSINSDTIQYIPDESALLHYKGRRAFVVAGQCANGKVFDEHAVGLNGIEGYDGVYRDAEDGHLSGNNVEHGRVDSIIGFHLTLAAHDSDRVHYWVAAGKSPREAYTIHHRIKDEGILHRTLLTSHYWKTWLAPAMRTAQHIDEQYQASFLQCVLLIKSHIDKGGAVIASTDTTMLNYSRDTYAYCWPRDAAYALWPLIRLGYKDEPLRFFMFCRRVVGDKGYLMHKYQPDGALGASWHGYVHDNFTSAPLQADESAIVLFLFSQYYEIHSDPKLLHEFYHTLLSPIANFLVSYTGEDGLPLPSYDLWERLYETTTYTTGITFAALEAAATLADVLNEDEDALRWRTAAESMKQAAGVFIVNERLIKGIRTDGSADTTLDISSVYGAFMFGLYDDHQVTKNTHTAILSELRSGQGYARFADDEYNRQDPQAVGNPWFITSLWLAQYDLEHDNLDAAHAHLDWVKSHMTSTGILAEQIDPISEMPLGVSPLTWSQAEYVNCLLDCIPGIKPTLPKEHS